MLWRRFFFALVVLVPFFSAPVGSAQISKGQSILINRGLQLQGMVTRDDVFHLNTYSNANYTSINWLWDSNPSLMTAHFFDCVSRSWFGVPLLHASDFFRALSCSFTSSTGIPPPTHEANTH